MIIIYVFEDTDSTYEFETDMKAFRNSLSREQLLEAAKDIRNAEQLSNEELQDRLSDYDFNPDSIAEFYKDDAIKEYKETVWQDRYEQAERLMNRR